MDNSVKIRKDPPSGTILINRPDKRNAIDRQSTDGLLAAFEDFMQEKAVRAVILTGVGDVFCAGSDLNEIRDAVDSPDRFELWHRDSQQLKALIEAMLRFPKPIIAAVNGPVAGMGVAMMLAADIVIASETAAVSFPESRLGLSAGLTAPLLAFRTSAGAVSDLILPGRTLDAQQALARHLVHEIAPADFVWARANEVAVDCAQGARESHQMSKQMVNETIGEAMLTQLSIGAANLAAARTTEAAKEGVAAFLEKRSAEWE